MNVNAHCTNPLFAEPLFYLHHANLDRIWWQWQNNDSAKTHFWQIFGPTVPGGSEMVTLDFVMDFPGIAANSSVREVMDTRAWPYCYDYA